MGNLAIEKSPLKSHFFIFLICQIFIRMQVKGTPPSPFFPPIYEVASLARIPIKI
jgi:hypothetical protein